jgi:hypothetical protein
VGPSQVGLMSMNFAYPGVNAELHAATSGFPEAEAARDVEQFVLEVALFRCGLCSGNPPCLGGPIVSFGLYILGFVIFIIGLAWAASVAGVGPTYIGIGAVILLGIGIFTAVSKTRAKDPSS